jgi:WD40 repeat protein
VLRGHEAAVTHIAFDATGAVVATASADGTVRLWDVASGEPRITLRGHDAQVNKVVFLPDGRLVTAAADGTARVWDPSRGVQVSVLRHGGYIWGVSAHGSRLATASWTGTGKVWDLTQQTLVRSFVDPAAAHKHFASTRPILRNDQLIVFGAQTAVWWGLDDVRPRVVELNANVTAGALAANGTVGAVTDEQGNLRVFGRDGRLARIAAHIGAKSRDSEQPQLGATCAAVSPDGRRGITCGADGSITSWDLVTATRSASRMFGTLFAQATFSPDGQDVLVSSMATPDALLASADLGRIVQLPGHRKGIVAAAFAPDGRTFATLSWEGTGLLWSRDGRQLRRLEHEGPLLAMAWSPDGASLATAAADGAISRWQVADGARIGPVAAHYNYIMSIAFSPDGDLLATASADRTVKIWDAKQLRELASIQLGNDFAEYIEFDNRGRLLTTDSTHADLWNLSRYTGTREQLRAFVRCHASLELINGNVVAHGPGNCAR